MLVAFSVKFQQSHLLSRFLVTIYSQRVHAEGLNFSPILKSKSVSLLQSDYKKCRVNCPDTPPLQITTMLDFRTQSNKWLYDEFLAAAFTKEHLQLVKMDLMAANKSPIRFEETTFLRLSGTSPDGSTISCTSMLHQLTD